MRTLIEEDLGVTESDLAVFMQPLREEAEEASERRLGGP